jgi:hypothetical protein
MRDSNVVAGRCLGIWHMCRGGLEVYTVYTSGSRVT